MQEFIIMIGLSLLLAVAAFADVADPSKLPAKTVPSSSDPSLTSVPREHGANVTPGRPFLPSQGTATFVETSTEVSAAPAAGAASTSTSTGTRATTNTGTGAVPSDPPGMPDRRPKPSGFR